MVSDFDRLGYALFAPEFATTCWARAAVPFIDRALAAPELEALLVCEGTWFVGLDALPNDAAGRVGASAPLSGAAAAETRARFGWPPLHPAQLSVVFPGYPKPRAGESEAAFGYRLRRDAAHVDGVIGQGAPKRRFVEEPHAFILGIGLDCPDPAAAPLVVWEGSHALMRDAFRTALAGMPAPQLSKTDVTEIYADARKRCFETCARVELPLEPGSAVLLHPMLLHGVAPWRAGNGRRSTAYFRPPHPAGVAGWLTT